MKYYIRVDLGTSSVRALLIDSDGIQLAVAGVQYAVDVPRQGWAEQDPEEWYRKTCWVVSEAIEASGVSPEEIEAISFSGQMHGLVSLKEDRTPAAGSILWLDQRSDGAIEEIYQTFGREWVVQCTGNTIAAGFLLASLYWAKTHAGEFYDSIRWAFLPKDYVKYRLSGVIATDFSHAAGSLAFDNRRLEWSEERIGRLGLKREVFPQILPSTAVVGSVTPEAARLRGLSSRTLVANGGVDPCMQSIGNGIVRPGVYASNTGTAGQVSTLAVTPVFDPCNRTNTFAHVLPGCRIVMGACLNSGISRRWISKDIPGETDCRALDAGVGEVPAGCGAQSDIWL